MEAKKIGWFFPPLNGGSEHGFNRNDVVTFAGEDMVQKYVKEICQNSLDAKDPDNDKPVVVKFHVKEINSKDETLRGILHYINLCNDYWSNYNDEKLQRFIDGAKKLFSKKNINILVASDYNTTGLEGANLEDKRGTPWYALVECVGYSCKPSKTSGGSWGIGSNAVVAMSSLNTVFYNSFCKDSTSNNKEVKAFMGVSCLATMKDESGKTLQDVGYYRYHDDENEYRRPVMDYDDDKFASFFSRSEYGTDAISIGFVEYDGWEKEAAFGAIKNFFPAILDKKLIVEIKGSKESIVINDKTIGNLINEVKPIFEKGDEKSVFRMYETYINPDKVFNLSIKEADKDDAVLYLKKYEDGSPYEGFFRSNGMFINCKKRNNFKKYCSVFIAKGESLMEDLCRMEPPEHNRWDAGLLRDVDENHKAEQDGKLLLNKITDEIRDAVDDFFDVDMTNRFDAYGMSEYLPSIEDDDVNTSGGSDLLNPKLHISERKYKKRVIIEVDINGKDDVGDKLDIDADTNEIGGGIGPVHEDPHIKVSLVIPPSDDDDDDELDEKEKAMIEGVNPDVDANEGYKKIKITNEDIVSFRTFVCSDANDYKTIVSFHKPHERLYFFFYSLNEDDKRSDLKLDFFKNRNESIPVNGNMAGPISVEANERYEFDVRFKKDGYFMTKVSMKEEIPDVIEEDKAIC